jgi:hypothetical protein
MELITWIRVLEKLTVSQIIKKVSELCDPQRYFAVFTIASKAVPFLSQMNAIKFFETNFNFAISRIYSYSTQHLLNSGTGTSVASTLLGTIGFRVLIKSTSDWNGILLLISQDEK